MATQNNDVIGYIKCESGGRATVHQTKRGKGRYLYTRCECCGCDQRNGAAVQTRIFNNAEWLGDAPEAPPNLITLVPPVVQPGEPSKDAVVDENLKPEFEPKNEPEEPAQEPKPFVLLSVVGLLLGGIAIAIGRAA